MASIEDVARLAGALPGVDEGTSFRNRAWSVANSKAFVWERPFSKADIKRFGDQPVPSGPVIGVRTGDLEEKEAVLQNGPAGVFTIPHFDNYPAFLVQLDVVAEADLAEILEDAWLAAAPTELADAYLAGRRAT